MNLDTLQKEVAEWATRNFSDAQPHQPLLGVQEECGELAHAHLKMEQGIRGTASDHFAAKEDAIGDILIFLAHYCHLNGIAMNIAVENVWQQVKQRDWQKNPFTGNAAKSCKSTEEHL